MASPTILSITPSFPAVESKSPDVPHSREWKELGIRTGKRTDRESCGFFSKASDVCRGV